MMRALALALCLASFSPRARAQEAAFAHVVRAGETAASIAQLYYGDAKRAEVLLRENGLGEGHALPEGTRLVIPHVLYHQVARGESWRSVAERYYADASRAPVLIKANHGRAGTPPDEGAQLVIPYPLRHVVRDSESVTAIATHYYGGREEARLLRGFNGGRAKVARGEVVLVPLFDLVLSRSGLERIESSTGTPVVSSDAQRLRTELARDIARVRAYVQSGRFVEALALGNQLLGRGQLTGNQEISIQRELATAYVALGREDLATGAFARALDKQPDLELDSVRTSPRVLDALEAAKAQRR